MSPLTIVIAEDHPLFRAALASAVAAGWPEATVLEADRLDSLTALVERTPSVDLVLLDLGIPGASGLSGVALMRAQFPALPLLVVSATRDLPVVRDVARFGAAGFVPKTARPEEIGRAIAAVLAGDQWYSDEVLPARPPPVPAGVMRDGGDAAERIGRLTPQQVRVLGMLCEGLPNKRIATTLDVSEATVKAHVSAILQKLDVDSRTQAVLLAGRAGFITQPAGEEIE